MSQDSVKYSRKLMFCLQGSGGTGSSQRAVSSTEIIPALLTAQCMVEPHSRESTEERRIQVCRVLSFSSQKLKVKNTQGCAERVKRNLCSRKMLPMVLKLVYMYSQSHSFLYILKIPVGLVQSYGTVYTKR